MNNLPLWYLFGIVSISIIFTPFSIDPFEQPRFYFFCILNFLFLIFNLNEFYFFPKKLIPFHFLIIYLILYTFINFLLNFSFLIFSHLVFYFSFWIFLNSFQNISNEKTQNVLKFIGFEGFLEGLYGILQHFNLDPFFSLAKWAKEERMAVAGTIGTPAIFGIFLSITLIVQIYLMINLKKILYFILIIPTFISLIFNNTRSAIFGFVISLFYILIYKFKKKAFILIFIFLFFLFSLIILNKEISYRWKELFDLKKTHSATIRFFYWKVCLEIIKERPLLGNGVNSFSRVYFEKQRELLNENKIKKPEVIQAMLWAHNDFLQLWIEYGFFAFLLFFISLLSVILKKESGYLTRAVGILSFFSAIFLFPFYHPSTLFLMTLIFLIQNSFQKS